MGLLTLDDYSEKTKRTPLLNISEDSIRKVNLGGSDDRLINYPKIDETVEEKSKPELEPNGLEYGEPIPLTKTWKLLDMVGSKAFNYLGRIVKAGRHIRDTRGIPQETIDTIQGSTNKQLGPISKTFEATKGTGVGDEILGINALGGVSDNFFERRRFFSSRVPNIEANLREKTQKLFPGSDELQDKMTSAVQAAYKVADDKVKVAYQKVEDLGDDTFRYDVAPMRENILKELRDEGFPEPVIRNIKRNLFYSERNLTAGEKGAQSALPGLDDAFEEASYELAMKLPKKGEKDVLKTAEAYLSDMSKRPGVRGTRHYTELESAIRKYKATKTRRDDTEALLPDFNEVGEKEFIRLIREVNRKKFIGGGDIGKYDQAEQAGLTKAKKMIEDYFEASTKDTNPGISTAFKDARGTYRDKIRDFGPQNRGNSNYPELGKMVDKPYEPGQEIDTSKQIDSMLKSTYKIDAIGKILEKQSPGMKKEITEEWLYGQLGILKQGDTRAFDLDRLDLPGVSTQLDNIVSNPRAMKFIEKNLGKEKADEIRGLFKVTSSLNKLTQEITKNGDGIVGQSAFDYIQQGEGKLKKLGRTYTMIRDLLNDTGGSGGYSREVLDRVGELIDRVRKSNNDIDKSRAIEALKSETQKFLDGSFGKPGPTGFAGGGSPLLDDEVSSDKGYERTDLTLEKFRRK